MKGLVRAADFVIDILGALTGGGPEAGFWRSVERVLVVIIALALFSVLCFIVAAPD